MAPHPIRPYALFDQELISLLVAMVRIVGIKWASVLGPILRIIVPIRPSSTPKQKIIRNIQPSTHVSETKISIVGIVVPSLVVIGSARLHHSFEIQKLNVRNSVPSPCSIVMSLFGSAHSG